MRVSWLSLAFLAIPAHAQYFSDGWSPGQPVPTAELAPPTQQEAPYDPSKQEPKQRPSLKEILDVNSLLSSEPVAALFSKVGVNITERLEAVKNIKLWDDRVPLITDDNFGELVVNETMTEEEEKERVWVVVISASAGKQSTVSRFIDDNFDEAYNQTIIEGDLPHVRFGRIDYLNVTYLTTKWNVWQAPMIVIITDRGQTLRFYKSHQLYMRDGAFRDFLKEEYWKHTEPWNSSFAPGGENEYILDAFARYSTKAYNVATLVPKWLLYILSGSVASFIIGLMHRGDNSRQTRQRQQQQQQQQQKSQPVAAPIPAPSAAPPAQTSKASPAKLKKKGKK